MKTVFDEWYGTLSYAQRAAYRKYNVSPSDHSYLIARYGETAHRQITDHVVECSQEHGYYVEPFWRA